jgi:hypothetical protein
VTKVSTTQKSLNYLRERGYLVAKTEQWNAFAKIRIDAYGIIDMIAIKTGENGVLGVQSTTKGSVDAHVDKALYDCGVALKTWLLCGNKFVIHGWDGDELEITTLIIKNDLIMRGD